MFQQDNIVTTVTWSGLQKPWQLLMAARIKVFNIFYCHLIVNHILQSKSGWPNNSTTVSHLFFISTSIFWSVGTWTCQWISVSVHPNFYLGCFNCTIKLWLKSKLSLLMMEMVLFLIILCCILLFNVWDQLGNNTAITMSSLLIILRIKLPVLVMLRLLTVCCVYDNNNLDAKTHRRTILKTVTLRHRIRFWWSFLIKRFQSN